MAPFIIRASGETFDLNAEEAIQRQAMQAGGFTDAEIEDILSASRDSLPPDALQPTRIPGTRKGQ
jgi:hypothetical protein